MSTATLLIVTARLRSLAHAGGTRDPASSVPSFGWGRVTRKLEAWVHAFRPIQFRQGPAGDMPPRIALPARRLISPLACAGARSPFPRARVLVTACCCILFGAAPMSAAHGQETAEPRKIGGKAPDGPCVIVEIAGERAGHLDCATQRLQEAARSAQTQARAGYDVPVPQTGSPDTQLGIANQTATRLRMGSGFGNSVHPERPVTRPPRGGRQ